MHHSSMLRNNFSSDLCFLETYFPFACSCGTSIVLVDVVALFSYMQSIILYVLYKSRVWFVWRKMFFSFSLGKLAEEKDFSNRTRESSSICVISFVLISSFLFIYRTLENAFLPTPQVCYRAFGAVVWFFANDQSVARANDYIFCWYNQVWS